MATRGRPTLYESDELRLGSGQIRLLTISQSPSPSNDVPLECSLSVVDLDPVADYYALSYTWGAPAEYGPLSRLSESPDCPILCNGRLLHVTANLRCFLLRARQMPGLAAKRFWIDAICVNQQDKSERSAQVMLMANIYSTAAVVISWLGEQDHHTEPGFALLMKLRATSGHSSQLLDALSRLSPDSHDFGDDEQMAAFSCRQSWVSVAHVFQRRYFTRAWIIQEVVLAKTVNVLCGGHELDWSVIAEASHFFSTSAWAQHLTDLFMESAGLPPPHPGPQACENLEFCYQSATILRATAKERKQRKQQGYRAENRGAWAKSLVYTLIRARGFKSTDPRDKVYAVLGLVHEYAQDKPGLIPEYDVPTPAAAFTRAAIQILEDGGGDLLLLSCVEGEKFQKAATGRLPSWVPDWSSEELTGLRVTGYERYSASGELKQHPVVDREGETLSLHGIELDHVTMVGETKQSVLRGEPFPQWLKIVDSLKTTYRHQKGAEQHKVDVFWRTLISNTAGSPPQVVQDGHSLGASFARWFFETTGPVVGGSQDGQDYGDAWHALADRFGKLLDERWDAQSRRVASTSEFLTPFSKGQHLRLFRTAGGYLGFGTECVQVGDLVYIVPGSRVPLLLRRAKLDRTEDQSRKSRHRLVGGAYLHGVMDGECVSPTATGKFVEGIRGLMKTFTLE
ncbi:heterokaryon incompatibility protein-domain-containing protein [Dichotomopilus funicola]|uniref:Heterokaryon incompatibility protein-domain-containing protein n=1 Tax=Dichotomopilus funicola TaxID=1934379 RepID=A0AAN6UVL7_9PEZI|nr:heterokaryon incompatibility protein-domain-containing protein [Dichotomopilus funicola]